MVRRFPSRHSGRQFGTATVTAAGFFRVHRRLGVLRRRSRPRHGKIPSRWRSSRPLCPVTLAESSPSMHQPTVRIPSPFEAGLLKAFLMHPSPIIGRFRLRWPPSPPLRPGRRPQPPSKRRSLPGSVALSCFHLVRPRATAPATRSIRPTTAHPFSPT